MFYNIYIVSLPAGNVYCLYLVEQYLVYIWLSSIFILIAFLLFLSCTIFQVYTVCGIYLGCAVMAFLIIVIFLDKITLDKSRKSGDGKISPKLFLSTFKHWWNSTPQKLLTFLTIYSGIEQAFVTGDYTKVCLKMNHSSRGFISNWQPFLCSNAPTCILRFLNHQP